MFEVLTLEGWLDVRDMLVRDSVSPGIPRLQEAWVSEWVSVQQYSSQFTCNTLY